MPQNAFSGYLVRDSFHSSWLKTLVFSLKSANWTYFWFSEDVFSNANWYQALFFYFVLMYSRKAEMVQKHDVNCCKLLIDVNYWFSHFLWSDTWLISLSGIIIFANLQYLTQYISIVLFKVHLWISLMWGLTYNPINTKSDYSWEGTLNW